MITKHSTYHKVIHINNPFLLNQQWTPNEIEEDTYHALKQLSEVANNLCNTKVKLNALTCRNLQNYIRKK